MTQPSTIRHACVKDVLWVALHLTVTHSSYRTSFPIESTSLQIGMKSDVFFDVSLVSNIRKV